MTQVAKLEGYQEDQAKKLAKQQVEGASAMGQMFRLTTLQTIPSPPACNMLTVR